MLVGRPFPATGFDSITLERLDKTDSARLLASARTLPHEAAERVLAESGGNPLAILELPASDGDARTPAPVAPLPATGRLERQEHNWSKPSTRSSGSGRMVWVE